MLHGKRYYARALLTCLHRSIAVPEWDKLRRGESVRLERALGCFDLFVPGSGYGDLDQVSLHPGDSDSDCDLTSAPNNTQIQDSLTRILERFAASRPGLALLSPRDRALAIASWLGANGLTGIEPGREFHSLDHNFLGMALKNTGHNSLPLVSAAIYCFVARGNGLNAQPCGFPFHVHVIVTPQPGLDMNGNLLAGGRQGEPMYLDPFRGARETPVSTLRSQLAFLGMPNLDQTTILSDSDTSAVVLRCGNNIMNSVRIESQQPETPIAFLDVVGAKYAAIWSKMLLSNDSRPMDLRRDLPQLMELFATEFPTDVFLIEQYIVPLFRGLPEHNHVLESLRIMRAVDEIPKSPRRRTEGNTNIRYSVGQVFRHRRYNYTAIITGWDSECGAGEQWMMRMGIDRLEAGRNQSFYHVL